MTKTTELQAPSLKEADGTFSTQINNQIIIMHVFFNHNSTETFQDKLLRVILAERMASS